MILSPILDAQGETLALVLEEIDLYPVPGCNTPSCQMHIWAGLPFWLSCLTKGRLNCRQIDLACLVGRILEGRSFLEPRSEFTMI